MVAPTLPRGPVNLMLRNDGSTWTGTFHIVMVALFSDLIPDGAIEATVTYFNERDDEFQHSGWVVGLDVAADRLDWSDGATTPLSSILAVGI